MLKSLKVKLPKLRDVFSISKLEKMVSCPSLVRQINKPALVSVTQVNLAVAPLQTISFLVMLTACKMYTVNFDSI